MRAIIVDTETNGLPANRYIPYTKTENWPAIVQIAWEVWDFQSKDDGVKLWNTSFLVKPPADLVWNEESAAIHGISRAVAERDGVAPEVAITALAAECRECDIIVIHNLAFDRNIIWAAAHRTTDPTIAAETWWPKHELCTMLGTVGICCIPSTSKFANAKDPYKWPRLEELWTFLFPGVAAPQGLHDAGIDVRCLATCFAELYRRGVLNLPDFPTRPRPPMPVPVVESRFERFFRRVLSFFELS
jgi:DNA polymerase III epsilon subunit-like protein